MPIFLDAHHALELPVTSIRQFLPSARAASGDGGTVVPLDIYCGDGGRVVCVLSAPDEASVRKYHAGEGVVCRRIQRVESSAGAMGLTVADLVRVRQIIASDREPHPSEMVRRRLVG
jgi:hypothetical protein